MHSFLLLLSLFLTRILLTTATPVSNVTLDQLERRDGATYVTSISQCPQLAPRSSRPTSVHDLQVLSNLPQALTEKLRRRRPDDFAYTMAVGDSITAGAFLRGTQNKPFDILGLGDLIQWRGQSYAAGMDEGAVTIPNFMKYYNPAITGGSKGSYPVGLEEICIDMACLLGDRGWHPEVDNLNAARFGATASNLLHEVHEYLVPQAITRNIPRDKFKYLSLQIGSNELCWSCITESIGLGSNGPLAFEAHVDMTLQAIRHAFPNTLVNLIGVFELSAMHNLVEGEPYCNKRSAIIPRKTLECPCTVPGGVVGQVTGERMDDLASKYNERLIKIAKYYQQQNYTDFAVVWQPSPITLGSYPVESLSDVDCHHPSLKTHQLVASGIWNRLVGSKAEKEVPISWNTSPTIRCLQEDDRILTNTLL